MWIREVLVDFSALCTNLNSSSINGGFRGGGFFSTLGRMSESEWTKILGWPGYTRTQAMLLPNLKSFVLCLCLADVAFAQKAPQPENSAAQRAPGRIAFREIPQSDSGITWSHDNARSPERYLPETVGGGCAFLDYDNDGWMDILFVNSGPSDFFHPEKLLRNALYHNNHDGTFTDVTDKAGLALSQSFGMGVAAVEYAGKA